MADSDELANTATAPSGSAGDAAVALTSGSTLGRYRIERELGAGGMGVVYVAFDGDLERRVALKVLRADDDHAAKRLLREARAMARLSHPNVVTVHEVGSAGGRDYVAMELVDGTTLGDWLRAGRRGVDEVIAAFESAGRGLAAAHHAGVVHRDFKPHNILRSQAGRVCVTDFGLARSAEPDAVTDPLAVTQSLSDVAASSSGSTSSPLSGLTRTGAVLGTPAYMAPEQWGGQAVTPATDQFAFCVALWEALVGKRPFEGPTLEELKRQVTAGPRFDQIDGLPRNVRDVLRRGLSPEPEKRWPTMDALLAHLAPAARPSRRWLAVGGLAVVGTGGVAAALVALTADDSGRSCPAALIDPATVVPAGAERGPQRIAYEAIARDVTSWRAARATVCSRASEPVARAQLACLDGVMTRLSLASRAATASSAPVLDVGSMLIDPVLCTGDRPPTLMSPLSPELDEVLRLELVEDGTEPSYEQLEKLSVRATADPCARGMAHAAAAHDAPDSAKTRVHTSAALESIDRCEDDRVRAEIALEAASLGMISDFTGPATTSRVARAEALIARVTQPDVVAGAELLRFRMEMITAQRDRALGRVAGILDGLRARGRLAAMIRVGVVIERLAGNVNSDDELARQRKRSADWREIVTTQLAGDADLLRSLDVTDAMREFNVGDVAGAHAKLVAAHRPDEIKHPITVRGRVVDAAGKPVAGAAVWAGRAFYGDEISIALPTPDQSDDMRTTQTGHDGTFILDSPPGGIVVAQHGELRSGPRPTATEVTLALAPTSRVEGRLALGGIHHTRVNVFARDASLPVERSYGTLAPVRADGTFTLAGVPRGAVKVYAILNDLAAPQSTLTTLVVDQPIETNVVLNLPPPGRTLHVLVRSTVAVGTANAEVYLTDGSKSLATLADLIRTEGSRRSQIARHLDDDIPDPARGSARDGDLLASFAEAPSAAATACALALPQELADPNLLKKITDNLSKLELRCVPVPPEARVVTIEVPPFPRLE